MDFKLSELNIKIEPLKYLNESEEKTQIKTLRVVT